MDIEHAVNAAIEIARGAEVFERDLAHAGHDAHAEHDVDRIRQFDTDLGKRRAGRTHELGNDVNGAPLHGDVEQSVQTLLHFGRISPVVQRAGFFRRFGADESEFLDARDVVRGRAMIITAREF